MESTKRDNKMKKTAVQWLVDELLDGKPITPSLIEQAQEMEKHHLIDAHISGYEYSEQSKKFVAGHDYFATTYEEPYEKP